MSGTRSNERRTVTTSGKMSGSDWYKLVSDKDWQPMVLAITANNLFDWIFE